MAKRGERTPLVERLSSKIAADRHGCWIWTGKKDKLGYGKIRRGGTNNYEFLAHRAVYELAVGPVPGGMDLDHLCRNPSCVNPSHLEAVSHRENIRRGARCIAKSDATTTDPRVKTCRRGHPVTPESSVIVPTGHGRTGRHCRVCAALKARERYYARKGGSS
jgi:HNH endonuclease